MCAWVGRALTCTDEADHRSTAEHEERFWMGGCCRESGAAWHKSTPTMPQTESQQASPAVCVVLVGPPLGAAPSPAHTAYWKPASTGGRSTRDHCDGISRGLQVQPTCSACLLLLLTLQAGHHMAHTTTNGDLLEVHDQVWFSRSLGLRATVMLFRVQSKDVLIRRCACHPQLVHLTALARPLNALGASPG